MRLWVLSDLHLDVNDSAETFRLPSPVPDHDAVVIAGDVCEDPAAAVTWIAESGLARRPVVYVPGNHEYYGRDRQEALAEGRRAAADQPNIHLLDGDSVDLDGCVVHGATLWTDYALSGNPDGAMRAAERLLSDHRLIRNGARAWTASDARAEHGARAAWLGAALRRHPRTRNVVVTHHAPALRPGAVRFRDHPLAAAFASDLSGLLDGAALWVHGHTHAACDYTHAGCRIVNNPRGYVRREQTGFDPALVVSL